MSENNIAGAVFIVIGVYYFFNPNLVLYGIKIEWSYLPAHLFFAITHVALGGFILYRENFSEKFK